MEGESVREFEVQGQMKFSSMQYQVVDWRLSEYVFLPHWHHHLEILRIIEGTMTMSILEEDFELKLGDIVIVNPNEVHFAQKTSETLVFEVFQIDLFKITENLADIQQKFLNQMFHMHRYQIKHHNPMKLRLDAFLNAVLKHWENESIFDVESLARKMLVELLRLHKFAIEDENQYKIYKHNLSKLKPTVAMIHLRYNERITLDILAEIAGLSAIHYMRLFKSTMRFTPIDFLNHIRVKEAMKLLAYSTLSIADIAERTGLNDANYFSRFFKHYSNMTPSAYRKKYK